MQQREADRTAALLDRRTAMLATRPGRARRLPEAPRQSVIVWSLDASLYSSAVATVAAVIAFAGCAPVPTREAACIGVIGRAGRFYSVIDLRRLMGGGAPDVAPAHLLLLSGAAPYVALAVDRVLGRFDCPAAQPAFDLDGRLVAAFDPADLLSRLGLSRLESEAS
jgi:hypothetical protein